MGPYRYWTLDFCPACRRDSSGFHLDSVEPLALRLSGIDYALPQLPGYDYTRPEGVVPHPQSDYTVVTRTYTF